MSVATTFVHGPQRHNSTAITLDVYDSHLVQKLTQSHLDSLNKHVSRSYTRRFRSLHRRVDYCHIPKLFCFVLLLIEHASLFTIRRKESLRKADITHIVSVLRLPFDHDPIEGFRHHVVEVDDVVDDNFLEHFPDSNKFIKEGLDGGGGVLVHW